MKLNSTHRKESQNERKNRVKNSGSSLSTKVIPDKTKYNRVKEKVDNFLESLKSDDDQDNRLIETIKQGKSIIESEEADMVYEPEVVYTTKVSSNTDMGLELVLGLRDAFVNSNTVSLIKWSLNMIPLEDGSGIKSMKTSITSIQSVVKWDIMKDELTPEEQTHLLKLGGKDQDSYIVGELNTNTKSGLNGKKWNVVNELEVKSDDETKPKSCDLDFEKMTMTIYN